MNTEEINNQLNDNAVATSNNDLARAQQKAIDDYQELLDKRKQAQYRLTDLGEQQGNAPQEQFDAIKDEIAAIDDQIAVAGKKIADLHSTSPANQQLPAVANELAETMNPSNERNQGANAVENHNNSNGAMSSSESQDDPTGATESENSQENSEEIENYNNRIGALEEAINNIRNMDDSAADNLGLTNQDWVGLQNELATVIRRRDREVEINNLRAEHRKLTEQRNAIDERIEKVESRLKRLENEREAENQQQNSKNQNTQRTATQQMLNPEFQPHLMPWNEYKKLYSQAIKENQDNTENQIALNNIHNKYKSDRRLFQKDENGNIICYDNTTIPKARLREIGEDPQAYDRFLVEKYGPAVEAYYKKEQKNEQQKEVGLLPENISNSKGKSEIVPYSPQNVRDVTNGAPTPPSPGRKEVANEIIPYTSQKEKDGNNPQQTPAPERKEVTNEIIPYTPQKEKGEIIPYDKKLPISGQNSKTEQERKTLQQIMYELQKGLEIKAKSGKRYQATNVKVGKNFKNELKAGNVWYNVVHFAPTLLKSAIASINKVYSKFQLWRTEQTHTMDVLKDRIDNLSDADLKVIWEEYRGTQVNQDSFTSALNTMLNERVQRFAKEQVTQINNQIATGYNQIFGDYQAIQGINEALGQEGISAADKDRLQTQKQALLAGKAEQIGNIRKLYIQGNNYYSGGAHGFSEDMKAAGTNLSKVGKRFAIKHDYDDELQERKAKLEMLEANAINNGNDEKALEAFIQYEGLKSDETQIGRGLRGLGTQRSEGKMYYSPLVGEMDYRDDPFIRDVFTTVAAVGAAVSAANAIHTHVNEANKVLDAEQAKAAQVNGTNQQTMDQVHQTGQDIAGHRDTFEKGMEAQANSDAINTLNTGERHAYDEEAVINGTGHGGYGSIYREIDEKAHHTAQEMYNNYQQQIQETAAKYSQGLLSEGEVTKAFADMAAQTNQTLNGIVQESLPYFQKYMETHPQFELAEVGKAMDYLVQNPEAIPQMYQGMVDVTNMGESLAGLSVEQVEALQSLPSDMQTTLLGAVSSAALAYNCARSTSKNRSSAKSEQEQQIIDMVSEYQANQQEQTTEKESSHQRTA